MVGNFLIGDIVGFKYQDVPSGILITIEDVNGDFMESLDEAERMALSGILERTLSAYVKIVKDRKQGKESRNGLEGKNEGMGRR